MPALANPQYEALARNYVAHYNMDRARREAGFGFTNNPLLVKRPEILARIQELNDAKLKAADVTAARVMLELARVGFADIRNIFDDNGALRGVHELDIDAAATIAGVEVETRTERDGWEIDLATGEKTPRYISVRTTKIKRYDKNPALLTLAKHFKIIGDENEGVNALASALAERLKAARQRSDLPMVERVAPPPIPAPIAAPAAHAAHAERPRPHPIGATYEWPRAAEEDDLA